MITGAEIISSIADRAQMFARECAHKFPACTESEVRKGFMSALLIAEECAGLGYSVLPDDVLAEIPDAIDAEDCEVKNIAEVAQVVISLIPTTERAET